MLQLSTKAPDFSLADQHGVMHQLSKSRGSWVVIYFYPKDDTPGCTTEACSFRDNWESIQAKASVFGISTDTSTSHAKFAEKYHLPFPLLADTDKQAVKDYQVGGIFPRRTTFVIDPQGTIAKIYDQVKPATHVAEILHDLTLLQS